MNIGKIIKILRKQMKELPDPSVTLVGRKYKSPFLVLISCLLSLRTKDETTLPASERLFKLAKTPHDMLNLKLKDIERAIYPVGFYRTKSKNILAISKKLVDEFNEIVPNDIDTLLTFNGVGRKTANLVLTEGFGIPGICVDTHVHRISNRIGFVKTDTPFETEMALRKTLDKCYWIEYNALLVLWGQNICRPVSPLCSKCNINMFCPKIGVEKHR